MDQKKDYDERLALLDEEYKKWRKDVIDPQIEEARKRPADVKANTMELAFQYRDKEKYPTEQDFSAFLQSLDDEGWAKYFESHTQSQKKEMRAAYTKHRESGFEDVMDEEGEVESKPKYTKPTTYDVDIPPRARRGKQIGEEDTERYSDVPASERKNFYN